MEFTLVLLLTIAVCAFCFFLGFVAGESKKVRDLRELISDFYKELADINRQIGYSRHFSHKADEWAQNLLVKIEAEKLP